VCVSVGEALEPETFISPSNRTHQCFRSPAAVAHYEEVEQGGEGKRRAEAGHVCVEKFGFVSPNMAHQQFLRLRDLYPFVLEEERRHKLRYSHMVRVCVCVCVCVLACVCVRVCLCVCVSV
jgi:hypothetical protein